ncbi:hypothetical protein LCGC14_2236940 [marine sediment metagenome]|uniref:Putative DnaT-like domain-containing protein n=1 Tax=marine sediment metagenome TaxID=412755 RepID=A0A0F9DU64_9ZZZZ
MAVAIVATAGSATANSYITLAEAETYMEGRSNISLWTAATDPTKNIALVESQRWLTNLGWLGLRADTVQALAWPRQDVTDPDDPNRDVFDSDEVPQRIKDAQSELALEFIKAGTTDISAFDSSVEIVEERVDVIATKYDRNRPTGTARYPTVMRYIRCLLSARPFMSPLVKG